MFRAIFTSQEGDAYWSLGSLTVLKAIDGNTDGSFSMVEERIPAGQSPPLHVHRSDDEMFYVLDGTVTFEVDGERFTAMDPPYSHRTAFLTATSPKRRRGG